MFIKRLILAFLLVFVPFTGMASSPAAHPVSPENGLKMLAAGNLRFALGQMTHPNTSFSRRLLTTTDGRWDCPGWAGPMSSCAARRYC